MIFHSILFERPEHKPTPEISEAPDFFVDLNLDQVIATITAGKQAYQLEPFFYTPLHDIDAIYYRQGVARDLENTTLLENIKTFAHKMSLVQRYLGLVGKLTYKYHKAGWFVEAVDMYCEAVTGLARDLKQATLTARGLLAFRDYITAYVNADTFMTLLAETQQLKAALGTVTYCVLIKGLRVKVRKYENESDYSAEVEATFEKFKQGAVKDYRVKLAVGSGMSYVEAQILDCVAKLYPDIFATLETYCTQHDPFLDPTIRTFDREIEFYVTYLDYIADIQRAGLNFCYPQISAADKNIYNMDGFDIALAHQCVTEQEPTICNDFYLQDTERIIVVSGPNQGGKTTFARAFGQLHYLACLGLPIPGREARLFLYDQLFTHFEKEEDIRNLRGKLQDDLVRIYAILNAATPNSIIIMNEIFTSTTLHDASFLGRKIMERIIQLDLLCMCVTFIDELADMSEKTVSMVSTIVPENPALRTYKIIRKPADGLAYAMFIAEKHRLTYTHIQERIQV
ncbi:MAG: DNA mismatch repair protein MutS [Anaerolineae bacterium]|nr:DNA mismatch repair protein MutS [Anaerolineae bacterium]